MTVRFADSFVFLAMLNVVGIRESASVALCMAVAALSVDAWVILCTLFRLGPAEFHRIMATLHHTEGLTPRGALIGFAGAWLAFSGLESIAQLSPTMRPMRVSTKWIAARYAHVTPVDASASA